MSCRPTVERTPRAAKLALPLALMLAGPQARALDGCLVLLCLAAPSWRAIPHCVPPIHQLFRDLSRGKPFPTCHMSGAGNHAGHRWATAPGNCPPQYTRESLGDSGPIYSCDFWGAITLHVNGEFWSRVWWSNGDSVTEYGETAKAQLPGLDTRFDDDFARWQANPPPKAPTCTDC